MGMIGVAWLYMAKVLFLGIYLAGDRPVGFLFTQLFFYLSDFGVRVKSRLLWPLWGMDVALWFICFIVTG